MDIKKRGEKGNVIKNYERPMKKARANVSLYNLTGNMNVPPAKGKTQIVLP